MKKYWESFRFAAVLFDSFPTRTPSWASSITGILLIYYLFIWHSQRRKIAYNYK